MSDIPQLPPLPVLEITAFVDSTTAVVTGHRVEQLKIGDRLYVLGIGFTYIPKINVPLIAPKAVIEVSVAAGPYVLARTPAPDPTTAQSLMWSDLIGPVGRAATRRPALSNDEGSFIGNPGKEPVKIGDVVVRIDDLQAYIKYRYQQQQSATT